MAVAKKISEFGVCAFPLVTVLGRFPLGQRTGKAGSVQSRSWLVVLSVQHIVAIDRCSAHMLYGGGRPFRPHNRFLLPHFTLR